MNLLSKILFTLVGFSILSFLIYTTYLSGSLSNYQEPIYENIELGLFELEKNNDIFSIENLSLSNSGTNSTGTIYINKINISDKVFSSTGNIILEKKENVNEISITSGVYVFDFQDMDSNYIIKGEGFEINNKGPGKFIINNIDRRKVLVFSLSTLLDLNLKNIKTNQDITSIDLYPHTYLLFNPVKNIFVKNSDLLKISQTFSLGYFDEQITNNNTITESFLNIVSLRNNKSKKIINETILSLKQENIEKTKIMYDFLKSSFGVLPGEKFIETYSNIFINPNKKSSFYKNIIIRNLHDLIALEDLDTKITDNIINKIEKLEKIDKDGEIQMRNIITFYYESILKSNLKLNNKINLSILNSKLNNKVYKLNYKSLIGLNKTFLTYDFINSDLFYQEIATFRNEYFNDLNSDKTDENTSIDNIEKVDYLLFFLENLILKSDFYSSNINTKDLIIIFDDYVQLSNNFYKFNDEKTKRTGIFTYSKILNKFLNILENKYFYKERNENLLLEIKENSKLIKSDISILEKNINEIILFYKNQTSVLNPEKNTKDKLIIKLYSSLEKKYKEYFHALNDYKDYLIKYDKSKSNLLSTDTINENDDTIILSENNAISYLQQFNGIQLKFVDIKVMDYNYCLEPTLENQKLEVEIPYCYKIDNINISGKSVSFLLHPFEKNKIDEITIGNISKAGSYKLDEIKIELDEKMKTESKDRDKYDFANFLMSTFGHRNITSNNNINNSQENNNILEEDPVVKIFKRNKLLGTSGDFAKLEGFLDINYNDLIVKRDNNDSYSIYINIGILNVDLGRNNVYFGEFSSDYNFSPKHSFINPKIKLKDKRTSRYLLFGNEINIIGEYKVNNIEEEIKLMFANFNKINYILNSTNNILSTSNVNISYIKSSNELIFDIQYKGGNLNIKLNNENITNASYNNINLTNNVINYLSIDSILNNIKK